MYQNDMIGDAMSQKYYMVLKYIAEKWKEPSTKAGLTIFFGIIGFTVSPENLNIILSVVGSILSILLIVMDESERKEKINAEKSKMGRGKTDNIDSTVSVQTGEEEGNPNTNN